MNKLEKFFEEYGNEDDLCEYCCLLFPEIKCGTGSCPSVKKQYERMKELESQELLSIELTKEEVAVLKSIDKEFKWIVRNSFNDIVIFKNKPKRMHNEYWVTKVEYPTIINCFNYMFLFIKNDDKEPYSIKELLRGIEDE